MVCGKRREEDTVDSREDYSCGFEAPVVETRKDSNIEGRNKEILVVCCVGIGIGNLLSEQCFMDNYH